MAKTDFYQISTSHKNPMDVENNLNHKDDVFVSHLSPFFLFCQESESRWIFILIPKNQPYHFSPQIHTHLAAPSARGQPQRTHTFCVAMPLSSSEMEEEIPFSSFAMRRMMDPSHHDDSDSSYSTPKGKSINPDDNNPEDDISYVSSSSNGVKKPAAATNGHKGTKAISTPKATNEKCQCKGCPGLRPTHLRSLMECSIES
jgi:hypothetical protein